MKVTDYRNIVDVSRLYQLKEHEPINKSVPRYSSHSEQRKYWACPSLTPKF